MVEEVNSPFVRTTCRYIDIIISGVISIFNITKTRQLNLAFENIKLAMIVKVGLCDVT